MKYIAVLALSLILLLRLNIRASMNAIFCSFFHKTDIEEEKKFWRRGLIVMWAIFTVAAFIFVIFFVE